MIQRKAIRALVTGLTAISYAVFMVMAHDWAQQFVRNVQQDPLWTWGAIGLVSVLCITLLIFFVRRVGSRGLPGRAIPLTVSWVVTLLLLAFAQWLLVSVHTEAIHYLQYGLFTWIVFANVKRIPATLAIGFVVALLDEAYQYWILYPDWPIYYDINDVILNVLAVGMTLLFLASTRPETFRDGPGDSWALRHADILSICATLLFLLIGYLAGFLAFYPPPDGGGSTVLLLLNRTGPVEHFWQLAYWSGRYYHQMTFAQGMLAVILFLQYYRFAVPMLLKPRS